MNSIEIALKEAGYKPVNYGSCYRMAAIYRGGDNTLSLAVDKATGQYYDYVTRKGGSLSSLIKLTSGKIIENPEILHNATADKGPSLIKVYPESVLAKLAPHYDRYIEGGIPESVLREFKMGFAHAKELARRYVFPVYNLQKEIIGFAGRWHEETPSEGIPKWKILGPKRKFVYPCHLNKASEDGTIILVESIGCALRLYANGIRNHFVTFGLSLGSGLLQYMLASDVKRIILALNNEPNNKNLGEEASLEIKDKLEKYFSPEKIEVILPLKKDFYEMSDEEINLWKQKAKIK